MDIQNGVCHDEKGEIRRSEEKTDVMCNSCEKVILKG